MCSKFCRQNMNHRRRARLVELICLIFPRLSSMGYFSVLDSRLALVDGCRTGDNIQWKHRFAGSISFIRVMVILKGVLADWNIIHGRVMEQCIVLFVS